MMRETICYGFVFLVEAVITWLYLKYIYCHKRNTRIQFLSFLLGYTVLYLLFCPENPSLNNISFAIVNFVIIVTAYRCRIGDAFFHAVLLTFLMIISELLVALWIRFQGFDFLEYTYHFEITVLMAALSKLLNLTFAVVISKIIALRKRFADHSKWAFLFCIPVLLSSVAGVIITSIGITSEITAVSAKMMLITIATLLAFNLFILILYSYIQKSQQAYLSLQLQLQHEEAETEYYQSLKKQLDQRNILVHDIKHHLAAISDLAEQKQLNEITDYIAQLQTGAAFTAQSKYCNDPVLNLVLVRYQALCREKSIDFHCDIRKDTTSFLDAASATAFFGNLLSNAVESAEQTKQREIDLSVTYNPPHSAVIVSVINSCEHPPLLDGNGNFQTRKSDPGLHGIGTKSIQRIIDQYHGISNVYFDSEKKEFHYIIQFPM